METLSLEYVLIWSSKAREQRFFLIVDFHEIGVSLRSSDKVLLMLLLSSFIEREASRGG